MTDPVVITVEQPPDPTPVIVPVPSSSEPIVLDFLQKEINEVEEDVKALRETVHGETEEVSERLTIIETVLDHLVDRISDIVEAATEEEPEPPVEEPSPTIPKATPKERRKRDTAPKASNRKRQLLLGRSGGIFSKNEGVYP